MSVIIRQKNKGRGQPWWIFVNHNGKRKSKKIGSRKAALQVKAAIEAKLAKGDFNIDAKTVPTFGEVAKEWLAFIEQERRESTYETYRQKLEAHVLPVFEKMRVDQITRGSVKDYLRSKAAEGFRKGTVALHRDVISGILGRALDHEIIQINPAVGAMKGLFKNEQKPKVEPFSEAELSALLETTGAIFPEHQTLFTMAVHTGMRLGELLAVRWTDINWDAGQVLVQRSYRRGIYTQPKNGKARPVDLSKALQNVLKDERNRQRRESLAKGRGGELFDLIFHSPAGHPFEQNFIRRVYAKVLKKADLRFVKFHGIRHSFATILLCAGEPPIYVSRQLGHSSIQITHDIYGHLMQTPKDAGVNRLNTIAPSCSPTAPTAKKKAIIR